MTLKKAETQMKKSLNLIIDILEQCNEPRIEQTVLETLEKFKTSIIEDIKRQNEQNTTVN